MKKLLKVLGIASIFAAILGFGFVACDNGGGSSFGDGDGDGGTQLPEITVNYTYHWDFSNATAVASKVAVNQLVSAKTKTPDNAYDLKLLVKSGVDGNDAIAFNGVKPTQTVGESSQTAIYGKATVGCVEPSAYDEVSVEVKGPFKATMYVSSNGNTDKTDRYARIMIGETEYCNAAEKSANKLPTAGSTVVATYTGTDRVKVTFGGTGITRIYDVIIEATNDQTPGASEFTGEKHTFTDAEIASIKLDGQISNVVSSDTTVVEVVDDGAAILAKKEGNATISISDGAYTATVAVEVTGTGSIIIGTVTNPFILDTTSKTLELTEEETGLASYASAEGETGVTASVSGTTLTYSVTDLTEACTKKITLKDSDCHEAEVTVTVSAIGEVRAAVSKKYVDPSTLSDTEVLTCSETDMTSSNVVLSVEGELISIASAAESVKWRNRYNADGTDGTQNAYVDIDGARYYIWQCQSKAEGGVDVLTVTAGVVDVSVEVCYRGSDDKGNAKASQVKYKIGSGEYVDTDSNTDTVKKVNVDLDAGEVLTINTLNKSNKIGIIYVKATKK